MGASTEAENESGEKPADLIDPDYKDLAKLFEAGCAWLGTEWTRERKKERKKAEQTLGEDEKKTYLEVYSIKETCSSEVLPPIL